MKKNQILLTGLVVFITILIAGGCKPRGTDNSSAEGTEDTSSKEGDVMPPPPPDVTIYLKDTLINGRKHLLMYDSKHPDHKVVDTLTTNVEPGDLVLWQTVVGSNIQHINNIRPILEKGKIFPAEAQGDSTRATYRLIIPEDAEPGTEKYEIVFTDRDNRTWCIDPHLRIPPTREVDDAGDR